MKIVRKFIILIITVCSIFPFAGCSDEPEVTVPVDKVLFMFFPWSENLSYYISRNISDMESVVAQHGLKGQRVIVYYATSASEASLFEIKDKGGHAETLTLKDYHDFSATTPYAIAEILGDVQTYAPANRYGMVVGAHGWGWLPRRNGSKAMVRRKMGLDGAPLGALTRYFGGINYNNQIDCRDFAYAVELSGLHFDFLVFDCCYMSSVEALYEMRGVADYAVASAAEIMIDGLPYAVVGEYLLGEADLKKLCDGFLAYYQSTAYPYATYAVTDLRHLDHLAAVMKQANNYSFPSEEVAELQSFDCYVSNPLFFDLGDYGERLLAADEPLKSEFLAALQKAVVYEVHTSNYYYSGCPNPPAINSCCGLTVSDPSSHPNAAGRTSTSWWIATH